jgi:hypothetical protein
MNATRQPIVIDQRLVAGNFQFATQRDRCLFIGTSLRDQPRWLEENVGRWWHLKDVQQEAAPLAPPVESEIDVGAAPAGPKGQTSSNDVRKDGDDQDDASLVDIAAGDCSPRHEPASPLTPVTATVANETTAAEQLRRTKAAMSETRGPKTETTSLGAKRRKPGRSGGRQLKNEKLPAEISALGRKRSPACMRVVLDSLAEFPVKNLATGRAGIERHTPDYWIKCSAAGRDGYDIEWRGLTAKFHEHYKSAMDEGTDKLKKAAFDLALGYDEIQTHQGRVVYKIDESRWSAGYRGPDAYLKDENGHSIPETVRKQDPEMIRWLLERLLPDKFGKHRKIDVTHKGHTGGVLVVGAKSNTEKHEREFAGKQQIQDIESVFEDDSEGEK